MGKKRIIVGISGASGFIYGVTMLRTLADAGIETHCVISKSAMRTGQLEYAEDLSAVKAMATVLRRRHGGQHQQWFLSYRRNDCGPLRCAAWLKLPLE